MPTSTQASSGSAAASPQTPTGLPACVPGLGGDRDQLQHGGLPRVGEVGEVGGHPVGGHRVLGQVVGADREEVDDLEHPVRPAARRSGPRPSRPAFRPRARTLSAKSAASATVATIGAITQVSVPVRSAACGDARRAGGRAGPGCRRRAAARGRRGRGSPRPRGSRTRSACPSRRRGCGPRRTGPRRTARAPRRRCRPAPRRDGSSWRLRKHSSVRNSPTPSTGCAAAARADAPSATLASILTGAPSAVRARAGPGRRARPRCSRSRGDPRRPPRRRGRSRSVPAVPSTRSRVPAGDLHRAGDADHARDAELAGDDRGVAGRAAALGHQGEHQTSGRGRRCRPARGPRRPARDGGSGTRHAGLGLADEVRDDAALDVAQVGDPLGHQAAHAGEDARRTARRPRARRRAGRRPASQLLARPRRAAPCRGPGRRSRSAPRRRRRWPARPCAANPSATACGRVVVRRERGVGVGEAAVAEARDRRGGDLAADDGGRARRRHRGRRACPAESVRQLSW